MRWRGSGDLAAVLNPVTNSLCDLGKSLRPASVWKVRRSDSMNSALPGEGSLLLLLLHPLCHVQVPERHPDLVSSVTASTQHKADTWDSVRSMRN